MKGVSKYGQFIVKSVDGNENAPKKDAKNISKTTTKLTIKDGKLQPALRVRSQNIPLTSGTKKERTLESYFEVLPNPPSSNVLKTSKITNAPTKNTKKINVYCDENKASQKSNTSKNIIRPPSMTLTDGMPNLAHSRQPSCSNGDKMQKTSIYDIFKVPRRMERSAIEENSKKRQIDGSCELNIFDSGFASGSFFSAQSDASAQSNGNLDETDDSPMDLSVKSSASLPKRPKKSHNIDIFEDYSQTRELTGMKPNDLCNAYKDYGEDIYKYMCWQEANFISGTSRDYMSWQKLIKPDMRENLIDWFSDVLHLSDLTPSTLFLAVSILDRTLSRVQCGLSQLQLVGCGALLIAGKVESRYALTVEDLRDLTDKSFTEAQIRKIERVIFGILEFRILVPGADTFANFYAYLHPPCKERKKDILNLLKYLLQLSCFYYEFVHFLPSHNAAAAFVLANYAVELAWLEDSLHRNAQKCCEANVQHIPITTLSDKQYAQLDHFCWPAEMRTLTGIRPEQICEPIKLLVQMHKLKRRNSMFQLFKKCGASTMKMPSRLPFDPPQEMNTDVDVMMM